MARPTNADPELTRSQLLAAGLHVFSRGGLQGSRLKDVAQRAGVTEATIHHYFDGKEGLFDACLDRAFAELLETGLELWSVRERAPEGDRVRAMTVAAFRAARDNPDRSRFLLRAFLFEESDSVRRKVSEAQRALVGVASAKVDARSRFGRRLPLIGLGMLITRLSLGSAEEGALIGAEMGDANAAMEAYLVAVAEHTLLEGEES